MKKTTYAMMGAFVGGIIFVALIILICSSKSSHKYEIYDESDVTGYVIGGARVTRPLPAFNKVTAIVTDRDDHILWIDNFKGIAVAESDTVKAPVLVTDTGWMEYLRCDVDSDKCLTVDIDYNKINERYCNDSTPMRRGSYHIRSENFVIATVVVPRGTVGEVKSHYNSTLYLDSVVSKRFVADVNGRLVLNGCRIDRLDCTGNCLKELKLDGSTVRQARVAQVVRDFMVKCTTKASVIDRLSIDRAAKKEVKIDLKDANIGSFEWNPTDTTTVINLVSKKNNRVKLN